MESSDRVRLLEKSVAERIAAGEVVDRPASVVKELVENALDASASQIQVEIAQGGKTLIQVTDNGYGMSANDLQLAVQRFATSKLRTWEDLDNLYTMGFRGEALPSIGAVSRLEIRSSQPEASQGHLLKMEGAGEPRLTPCAAIPGTKVTVRDLFFNTPARCKFLRSASAEKSQIVDLVGRLAAAWPEIKFTLQADSQEVFSFPSDLDSRQRLAHLWKIPEAKFISIVGEREGLSLEGLIGLPEVAKTTRSYQLLLINGRLIRSANISQALSEGFAPLLEKGRFPVAMLRLNVDPAFVDVNVHPTKLEVRFADPQPVFSLVYRTVKEALERLGADSVLPKHLDFMVKKASPKALPAPLQSPPPYQPSPERRSASTRQYLELYTPAATPSPALPPPPPVSPPSPGVSRPTPSAPLSPPQADPSAPVAPILEGETPPQSLEASAPEGSAPSAAHPLTVSAPPPVDLFPAAETAPKPEVAILGQVYNTYIICRVGGKLWLVDQHTAQERINYENLAHLEGLDERSQGLLLPEYCDFGAALSQFLQDNLDALSEYGYQVEPFGPERFVLRGVPAGLPASQAAQTFRQLVEEMAANSLSIRSHPKERWREKIRAMASCKAAVKAGQRLSLGEMQGLVEGMLQVEHSRYCPHGRPTRVILEERLLERLFHRL